MCKKDLLFLIRKAKAGDISLEQLLEWKWCLSVLKLIEIRGKKMSLKRKRFNISLAPAQFIE